MRLAVACALLIGCYSDATVPCGDVLCPHGTVCAPQEDRCVTPAQVGACAGLAEGAACMAGSIADGFCHLQVCIEAGCGNRVTETGELCDDGNRTSFDGCSADCRSDERCGNGVVDFVLGEDCDCGGESVNPDCTGANSDEPGATCRTNCELRRCGDGVLDPGEWCDDGNTIPGDGCRADCAGRFTQMDSGTLHQLNAVWGRSPNDVYAVGGGRVLHYDGVHWTSLPPPTSSFAFSGVCGTADGSLYLTNSTLIWRLDGTSWTPIALSATHKLKAFACSATELAIATVVPSSTEYYIEFWTGTSWTAIAAPAPTQNGLVVYARDDLYAVLAGTIEHWDGNGWTDLLQNISALPAQQPAFIGTESHELFTRDPTVRYRNGVWIPQPDSDEIMALAVAGIDGDILVLGSRAPQGTPAIVQFDGTAWRLLPIQVSETIPFRYLNAAWVYAPGRAFVVGEFGTILY